MKDLIIDDGVASRGHRLCIYDAAYRVAAARFGAHATFGAMAVIEFATAYEANAEAVAARRVGGAPKPIAGAAGDEGERTQWAAKLGDCAGCGQPIKGGAVVEIPKLGNFHKVCFACASCDGPLLGLPYIVETRAPYCKACHTQLFAPTCRGCSQKIAGGGVTVGGAPYHKECKPTGPSSSASGKSASKPASGRLVVGGKPVDGGRRTTGAISGPAGAGGTRAAVGPSIKGDTRKPVAPGPSIKGDTRKPVAGPSMGSARIGISGLAANYAGLG